MTAPVDFAVSLPPDWEVMDIGADTAAGAAQQRIRAAVGRAPSLGPHRRELAAAICTAAERARAGGVRLAAGWAGLGRLGPICAGLVVHVTASPPSDEELVDWLRDEADAGADRVVERSGSGLVRLCETRSLVPDRRSRRALPTTVVRFHALTQPLSHREPAMATLTFTTTATEERTHLIGVFDTVATTFSFGSSADPVESRP